MTLWLWIISSALLLVLVGLDLRLFHPSGRRVLGVKPALAWSAGWIVLALAFDGFIYLVYHHDWLGKGGHLSGSDAARQFLTAYLVERSLSLDNLFVIAVILSQFRVPLPLQHRVLTWAVLSAVLLRGLMITGGVELIDRYRWTHFVLAALLLLTAGRVLFTQHDRFNWTRIKAMRGLRKVTRMSSTFEQDRFIVHRHGRRWVTPLLAAVLVIQWANLVFAFDAIPAALAMTSDRFLVFTSNMFAVLGLRSLYFALLGTFEKFRFIKLSLVVILIWVAVKMLLRGHMEMPPGTSLAVVLTALTVGATASVIWPGEGPWVPPLPPELAGVAEVTWNAAKRLAIIVIGFTVVLIGIAMIVLPGPAVVVIPLGLMILASEFVWAQRLLKRARKTAKLVVRKAKSWRGRVES
jgi:tellurite resistance protein TerC